MAAQRHLKASFVERGLMLGEFHRHVAQSGLHSREFFPLRTADPTLVIRFMVPNDLIFLEADDDLLLRPRLLRAYLKKFDTPDAKAATDSSRRASPEQLARAKSVLAEFAEPAAAAAVRGSATV